MKLSGEDVAALVTDIPHKQHSMYKVTMESGYNNIFFTDVESGNWVEEDLGFTKLAKKIGVEICNYSHRSVHVPKLLMWHTFYKEGKQVTFGAFNFMNADQKMFEIYHSNRKYMFTLVQQTQEDWQVLGNDYIDIDAIDCVFIEHVIKVIAPYTYQ